MAHNRKAVGWEETVGLLSACTTCSIKALNCPLSLEDPLFTSFEITISTSYLTDLQLDAIFEDIDTSMYDTCYSSALPVPSVWGGSSQPSPLDNGLKIFSTCTSASALKLCSLDLSDLDHITKILVRS
ncbi:cell division cycle-associated protein 4-like isoform X2 [Arapaima gigas]